MKSRWRPHQIDGKVVCAAEGLDETLGNLIDNALKSARTAHDISGRHALGIADALLPGKRPDETVRGDGFELVGDTRLLPPENRGPYGHSSCPRSKQQKFEITMF